MSKLLSFTISILGTKGGILKTTLVKTLSSSSVFLKYKIGILEVDQQNNIKKWLEKREKNLPLIYFNYDKDDKNITLESKIEECKRQVDFLFVDFPGESEVLGITKRGLIYSDLSILPHSFDDNDIDAFDQHIRPILRKVLEIKDKRHFRILPIKVHHKANKKNYLDLYKHIQIINTFDNMHTDNKVFTYFTMGKGLTLEEYAKERKNNKKEYEKTKNAIKNINSIALEIIKISSNLIKFNNSYHDKK